ncbi:MAG TPA: DUF488 family protein [Pseudonocardiaceae bacterium]|jgi:uncharacterized protein YeaO (DUF488 family)|nr:DUF488 family protein [Pseudonocardiaceae bacterium]
MPARPITVHRVYDETESSDGVRVLVDRLRPRGLSKAAASVDVWAKNAAPSTGSRRWFGHEPEKLARFADRYRAGPDEPDGAQAPAELRDLAGDKPVALLTATRDVGHSHATVLAEVLRGKKNRRKS